MGGRTKGREKGGGSKKKKRREEKEHLTIEDMKRQGMPFQTHNKGTIISAMVMSTYSLVTVTAYIMY